MASKNMIKAVDDMSLSLQTAIFLTEVVSPESLSADDVSMGMEMIRMQLLKIRAELAVVSEIICPDGVQAPALARLVDTMN
jgi:hypothetical protein